MPNQLNFPDEDRSRLHEGLNEVIQSMASKKRKRGSMDPNGDDSGSKRGSLTHMNGAADHMNGSSGDSFSNNNEFANLQHQLQNATNPNHDASSTAAAALAAHLGAPENSGLSFVSTGSGTDGDRQIDSSFDLGGGDGSQNHNPQGSPYNMAPFTTVGGTAAQVQAAREASNGGQIKPAVGTDEWHKVRRDNHKEVERRRRETINEGINELAKIVPGCEKNKGSILQRAVHYIMDLKRQHDELLNKQTLEKVVLEQALAEVTNRNEVYKDGMEKAWADNRALKAKLRALGVGGGDEAEEGEEGSAEGESE